MNENRIREVKVTSECNQLRLWHFESDFWNNIFKIFFFFFFGTCPRKRGREIRTNISVLLGVILND
jgi:hypothetical protein